MRDEEFIRGSVPMTKSEVRAVSISKLELNGDSVLYDIGAGTGSVSIECARILSGGMVYAIEKNSDAISLIKANIQKFGVHNVVAVEGEAPQAAESLPAPTHAFLGGTAGNLAGILDLLLQKNPSIRIVMNVIALESLSGALLALKERNIEAEVVSMQISKAKKAGQYHLMQGQNPIYILSFGGNEETG